MESTPKPGPDDPERAFPIVGIGASAGGLNPLVRFLSALPDEFGFALVFMQHLPPAHKSLLPELLSSRKSALMIEEVADGLEILPGRLYICSPAQEVRIETGIFRVIAHSHKHVHLPIDEFFISLAEYAAERAIAVIFSGAGTDGARGVHAVRTAGGTVFVQDPATAEFSAMPLAALGTGQVDAVLTPEEIAREILKFHSSGMVAASPDGLVTHEHLEPFYRLIHEKTGYRFNHYKKSVISRRIKRRMYLHGLSSVGAYLEKVAADDGEARSLASDLMIGVTSFFRDRLAWEALHLEVTRKLVAEDETSPLRVWTPACATGEEAYSIAMLLRRELDRAGTKREIQVFATDVNDQALEKAREGTYPASIAADVQADYLSSFFTPSEDGLSLTVDKEIRQLVVFAKQDILTDPPFSRLDLVICRNLLIYLEPDAQEKCIALFHYALKEGGYLFLGGAESPGRTKGLFTSLAHKKCRIYRKVETKASTRTPLAVPFASEHLPLPIKQASTPRNRQSVVELSQEALLEEFAPAAVTINQNYDILYNNGPTGRYLRQPRGPLTSSLLDLLPESGRNRIRGALFRAGQDGKAVSVRVGIPDDSGRIRQVTIRISNLREGLYLVLFREKGSLSNEPEQISPDVADMEEAAVRQLEQELSTTRDDLQGHIEQLKSLNEELHSSNEELQAANEELETSREELQSLNEELTTVNGQLQTKIEDEEETNNDLANFQASTNIPTIFLDHRLRVKRFTPAMVRLIKLLPGDVGRPIIDMSQAHLGPDLARDAQSVLDNLTPVVRELGINSAWYVRNILPYRTSDNRIEGVVITYTDITERKRAEEELRESRANLQAALASMTDAVFISDADGNFIEFNDAFATFHRFKNKDECYKTLAEYPDYIDVYFPDGTLAPLDMWAVPRALRGETATNAEYILRRKDTGETWVGSYGFGPIRDKDGAIVGSVVVGRDITDRKRAEEALRLSEEKFAASFASNAAAIALTRLEDGLFLDVNDTWVALNGYSREEAIGRYARTMHIWPTTEASTHFVQVLQEKGSLRGWEQEFHKKSGEVFVAQLSAQMLTLGGEKVILSTFVDITERKRAEEALRESQRLLQDVIDGSPSPIFLKDRDWKFITINTPLEKMLGMTREELKGKTDYDIATKEMADYWRSHDEQVMKTGKPLQIEEVADLKDGHHVFLANKFPLVDASGQIYGVGAISHDITAQRRVEDALHESEQQLRMFYESGLVGMFSWHIDGRLTEVNDQFLRMVGYSREDFEAGRLKWPEMTPPEYWPLDQHALEELKETGLDTLYEKEFIRKDGSRIPIIIGAATTNEDRTQGVAFLLDITDRKKAEEEIRKSFDAVRRNEEQFRALIHNVASGVALIDETGKLSVVNPEFLRIFGLGSEPDILNINSQDWSQWEVRGEDGKLLHVDDHPVRKAAIAGKPVINQLVAMRNPGANEPIWMLINAEPLLREDGTVYTVICTYHDITERKQAEEALRKAHDGLELRVAERTEALRRQADLLELAYNAIIVRDLNGRITFWNARAEEIYGFTRNEALGQAIDALLQTRFPVPPEEHMAVLTTQGRWEGELTHTTKDGRQIVVLSRQALQRDEAGRPVAIIEINLDVTEQRRVEEHLRQAQKMEALGTLSGGIAHDFNNILAAIIGFTELVTGHADRGSRDAHSLERVMEAAIRGRELVRQMLTFSRKSEHEKKPVSLSAIVRESVRLLRAAVPSSIDIKVDVASESGFILADPVQVQQVLMNLCTNAAHAMREKGGTLDIKVDDFSVDPSTGNDLGMASGQYMRLLVRDTGIGMPPDVMKRIFDPFYTTKGVGEGTGLGLSVVHGIVEQHDGHITVESEPGRGSTFTVCIPRIAEEPETDVVSDDEIPTGSERVLFVDDEEALVEMGEDILAELGYEVTSRMNGREALALFRLDPSRFDLVMTDQTMPGMTGIDLAGEILAIRADMPIIMCTGFSHLVDADKATAAGIKAFAMKPLTKKEIATTIRKVLDQ